MSSADLAPIKPLPQSRLLSVEYPGYVESTENAIRTLGGEAALKMAFQERPESLEVLKHAHIHCPRRVCSLFSD